MRQLRVIVIAWWITGAGAVVGSLLGDVTGARDMVGASVLGTLALLFGIRVLASRNWLDPDRRKGGSIGGLVGFALAAAFAAVRFGTPSLLVLAGSTLLVGVGVLVGAGWDAAR
jgi:hypothetical protein